MRVTAVLCAMAMVISASQRAGATSEEAAAPHAEVAPTLTPVGDLLFESVLELGQKPAAVEPKLRGGSVANSADWPASFYATFVTPRGIGACTAALVGPKALLTAAHCVPPSGRVGFRMGAQAYQSQCKKPAAYPGDPSADYALCKVEPAFVPPAGFLFETIDTSGMAAVVGKSITLTGYGCINDDARNPVTDRRYRIGTNQIYETSASTSRSRGAGLYAPNQKNNLFTRDAGANLCPGDSGGPAFVRASGATSDANRRIIGVNSRVFYRDAAKTTYGSSMVSATGGPDFKGWATQWANDEGASICGVHGSIPQCRQ